MGTKLFESHYKIPLSVDAATLESNQAIQARLEGALRQPGRGQEERRREGGGEATCQEALTWTGRRFYS